jgi:hypothetical protein
MNKFIVGEIIVIFITFFLLWNSELKNFFMETIIGNVLIISLVLFYYYLDKYLGVFFCINIVCLYYMNKREPFFYYMNADSSGNTNSNAATHLDEEFRKNNCSNDELLYKGNYVKNDMIEHIFPEVKFKNNTCNPCNKKCEFNIIENENLFQEETLGVSTLA